jgi:prepilin-type N-terminal cleavage/methylation domain-containing protein
MKKKFGFTLIELVVVMVLIGIIAIVVSKILFQGFNAYLTTQNVTDADWQGRLALERMRLDIMGIRSPSDISTASANQLVFTDSNGNSITYTLSGSTLTRSGDILADGINSLQLTYLDKNGSVTATTSAIRYITIQLNVTKSNTNFNVSTSVYPRNLP